MRWKAGDDLITHATPTLATIAGIPQVLFLTQRGLVAVGLDGAELWRQAFPFKTSTAASPVVAGDLVYCSAGYGVGAACWRLAHAAGRFTATEVWRRPDDHVNHWSTPVLLDGHLYGHFGFKQLGKGPLKCIALATGAERWAQAGFGQGQALRVGDRLLALSDRGELALVQAAPAAYAELARAQAVGGKCWSMPAYAAGRLYVRGEREAACLTLAPAP